MEATEVEQEMAINREAYEGLGERIHRDYQGQYVALAQGKLIAAASSFDQALAVIQRLEPRPECYLIFQAEDEPVFEVVSDYFTRPSCMTQAGWRVAPSGGYWIGVAVAFCFSLAGFKW